MKAVQISRDAFGWLAKWLANFYSEKDMHWDGVKSDTCAIVHAIWNNTLGRRVTPHVPVFVVLSVMLYVVIAATMPTIATIISAWLVMLAIILVGAVIILVTAYLVPFVIAWKIGEWRTLPIKHELLLLAILVVVFQFTVVKVALSIGGPLPNSGALAVILTDILSAIGLIILLYLDRKSKEEDSSMLISQLFIAIKTKTCRPVEFI